MLSVLARRSRIDVTDEASIATAAQEVRALGEVRLVIVASGASKAALNMRLWTFAIELARCAGGRMHRPAPGYRGHALVEAVPGQRGSGQAVLAE